MITVLLFLMAVITWKLLGRIKLGMLKQTLCVGTILICLLVYLVSLIPLAFWPVIIWLHNR